MTRDHRRLAAIVSADVVDYSRLTISFSIQGRQYIAVSAGGGALASLQVGMTPEADMTPGSNATYVFAFP